MAIHRNDKPGNNSDKYVMIAVIDGIILGIATTLAKIVLNTAFNSLLFMPATWITAFLALTGFVLMQLSLNKANISIVIPVITGLSIASAVITAFFILGESLTTIQTAGIVLILIGTFGIAIGGKR